MFAKLQSGEYTFEQFKQAMAASQEYNKEQSKLWDLKLELKALHQRRKLAVDQKMDPSIIDAKMESIRDEESRIGALAKPEEPERLTTKQVFDVYRTALERDPANVDLFMVTQSVYHSMNQQSPPPAAVPVVPPVVPQEEPPRQQQHTLKFIQRRLKEEQEYQKRVLANLEVVQKNAARAQRNVDYWKNQL